MSGLHVVFVVSECFSHEQLIPIVPLLTEAAPGSLGQVSACIPLADGWEDTGYLGYVMLCVLCS